MAQGECALSVGPFSRYEAEFSSSQGPTVFMEYVDNPKATAEAKTDDLWYKSGDIATCDELGNLTVVDRIKELFKVSGFQVSPVELEAILITHPSVAEACVIGIPDNQRGEIPKAFLVLKPNAQASDDLARDIADFLAKKVAPKKKLYGGIEFVPEIVKNTSACCYPLGGPAMF